MKRTPKPPKFITPLMPCNRDVHRCAVPADQASHRILIMRLGAFGDVLMGTPLLAALRQAWPDAHLTWIVEHSEQAAIDANPYIDEVIVWESAYWKKMLRRGLYPLWLARALAFQRELRRRRYDIHVSFQPEEWPLLLRGSGARLSVGIFDTFRRYYGNPPTSRNTRFYTHAYAYPDLPPHRIDQYLLTLEALGLPAATDKRMSIGFTKDDTDTVERFLSEHEISPGQQFVILAPLTSWPSKCWPAERYAQLGDLLARRQNCKIVLIGAGRECEVITALAAQMTIQPIIAAGNLSFRQMAALLARAKLVVSGDTGPMHTAAAVGTPYLALFGATSAAWYGPQGARGVSLSHPVPCGPCDQKFCPNSGEDHLLCLRLITVEEALAAAEKLLAPATT